MPPLSDVVAQLCRLVVSTMIFSAVRTLTDAGIPHRHTCSSRGAIVCLSLIWGLLLSGASLLLVGVSALIRLAAASSHLKITTHLLSRRWLSLLIFSSPGTVAELRGPVLSLSPRCRITPVDMLEMAIFSAAFSSVLETVTHSPLSLLGRSLTVLGPLASGRSLERRPCRATGLALYQPFDQPH